MIRIESKESLLVFEDEDKQVKKIWVRIISTKDGLLTYKTKDNLISIPLTKVIKIKEKNEEKDDKF